LRKGRKIYEKANAGEKTQNCKTSNPERILVNFLQITLIY